jgi:hypothetical protein
VLPDQGGPTIRPLCGTGDGWRAHQHKHEEQCRACRLWAAARRERELVCRPESHTAADGLTRWQREQKLHHLASWAGL